MLLPAIDYQRLFKLRLVVARIGEMDNARWWNTNKLLGSIGATALKRGFPSTHYFAQARAVFAVATARSREIFPPPAGCVTLWSLPAEIEDEFENSWHEWLDDPLTWTPFFEIIKEISGSDLLGCLRQSSLVDDAAVSAIAQLSRSAENRAVAFQGEHHLDDHLVTILAGAYSLSDLGSPAIPYAKVRA